MEGGTLGSKEERGGTQRAGLQPSKVHPIGHFHQLGSASYRSRASLPSLSHRGKKKQNVCRMQDEDRACVDVTDPKRKASPEALRQLSQREQRVGRCGEETPGPFPSTDLPIGITQ